MTAVGWKLLEETADLLDLVGERSCACELSGATCPDLDPALDRWCEPCRARDLGARIALELALAEGITT